MQIQVPGVLRRHGGRHAIVVSKGIKLYVVVEMEKNRLQLRRFAEAELGKFGYAPVALSPYKAATNFLKHTAGLSDSARTALEELSALSFMD